MWVVVVVVLVIGQIVHHVTVSDNLHLPADSWNTTRTGLYTLLSLLLSSPGHGYTFMSSSPSGGHGYTFYVIIVIIRRTCLHVLRYHRHHQEDMATCLTLSSSSSGGHGYTYSLRYHRHHQEDMATHTLYVIIVIIRRTWLHILFTLSS